MWVDLFIFHHKIWTDHIQSMTDKNLGKNEVVHYSMVTVNFSTLC